MRWFFLCLNVNEACFSERIRHKKAQDAEGELVFKCFGTVPHQGSFERSEKNPFRSKNFYLPFRQHVHPPSHQNRALRVDFFMR